MSITRIKSVVIWQSDDGASVGGEVKLANEARFTISKQTAREIVDDLEFGILNHMREELDKTDY